MGGALLMPAQCHDQVPRISGQTMPAHRLPDFPNRWPTRGVTKEMGGWPIPARVWLEWGSSTAGQSESVSAPKA